MAPYYRSRPGSGLTHRESTSSGVLEVLDQRQKNDRNNLSQALRLGGDYYIDNRNTISSSFLYRYSTGDRDSRITSSEYSSGAFVSQSVRTSLQDETRPNYDVRLRFDHKFPQKGHTFKTSFQVSKGSEDGDENISEIFALEDGTPAADILSQHSFTRGNQNNFISQIDYIRPVAETGRFEAGYRGGIRRTGNDFTVEELDMNTGQWQSIAGQTNNFVYEENIQAAYALYGQKMGKVSYQSGLRVEYTDIHTDLRETNEKNHKNYFNFFPSAHITLETGESSSLQASYSRRIQRPRFWFLNPFFSFSNAQNIRRGNPDVNPEYTDAYEISFLQNGEKATFSSAIYYRYTTDDINRITTFEDGVTYNTPYNLTSSESFGLDSPIHTILSNSGQWMEV